MAKAAKKAAVTLIERIAAIVNEKLGAGSAIMLSSGDARSNVTQVVPTGLGVLDHWVMGCGGYPRGRLVEISGDESSGKTSFALEALAKCQAEDPEAIAILCESEHAFQAARAETFGVDPERLLLIEPYSLEDAINGMRHALETLPDNGPPSMIVWDSIAASVPHARIDEDLGGKKQPGEVARIMSDACKKLIPLASRKGTSLVFINQIRMKIGIAFGDPTTTPGGLAVPFFSSIRLRLWGGKGIKLGLGHKGRYVTVKAIKNKLSTPWRKARVRLDFEDGFNDIWSTLEHAKLLKLIKKNSKATIPNWQLAMAKLIEIDWGANPRGEMEVEEDPEEDDELEDEDDAVDKAA